MRVDPKIEEPLRRSFVAVVDEKAHGILPPLGPLDDKQLAAAVGYACFVTSCVMNRVYDGDIDAEAADVMAEDVVGDVAQWIDIGSRENVAQFLLACATESHDFSRVNPDDSLTFALVISGNLLSHYRPEGMRWFEYLDQIWNYAESLPDKA